MSSGYECLVFTRIPERFASEADNCLCNQKPSLFSATSTTTMTTTILSFTCPFPPQSHGRLPCCYGYSRSMNSYDLEYCSRLPCLFCTTPSLLFLFIEISSCFSAHVAEFHSFLHLVVSLVLLLLLVRLVALVISPYDITCRFLASWRSSRTSPLALLPRWMNWPTLVLLQGTYVGMDGCKCVYMSFN